VSGAAVASGRLGPIELGTTQCRIARINCSGTVYKWRPPFVYIKAPGARRFRLRAKDVARGLPRSAADVFNPMAFFHCFYPVHPLDLPGWEKKLKAYLRSWDAVVPKHWLRQKLESPQSVPCGINAATTAGASVASFIDAERCHLRERFILLANAARAPRTVRDLMNPGLKLLWWLASRGHKLPPSSWALTEYLVFLVDTSRTAGAVSRARRALLHLCRVNGWPSEPYTSETSMVPGAAIARLNQHQVKKTAGITLSMLRGIAEVYCFARPNCPRERQWELAIGAGIAASNKVFARWDDAAQLCWDDGFCETADRYIRFYLACYLEHASKDARAK